MDEYEGFWVAIFGYGDREQQDHVYIGDRWTWVYENNWKNGNGSGEEDIDGYEDERDGRGHSPFPSEYIEG